MDRYEYKLKVEQLEHLLQEKDYETAAEIADTINWRKVKSAATLCMVGEIYDRSKRYEDSREILLMAYDRAAVGRNVLYRLTLVALKMGNVEEAKDYYEEFLEVAPKDNSKYVLRYQIAKLDGASLQERIEILEEFKERDYREEWAFELAYLYHKAGDGARCAAACDELELWFGDGKYVEKALEMKMLHKPLDPRQEEKYRQFRRQKRGRGKGQKKEKADTDSGLEEMPDITPSPSKFNTSNLQAELAKGMQQIMNANTREKVTDTMDNIKRMVKDIPYLQTPPSGEAAGAEGQFGHIETEEEIDQSLNSQFNQYLAEDWDGQYRMHVPAGAAYETQVAGQINIDDFLSEWKRTQRAYEAAMENAKRRKLESAKARAWQEAQELMTRLNSIMPELEAGVSAHELLEKQYLQGGRGDTYPKEDSAQEGYAEGYAGEEGCYDRGPIGQNGYYQEESAGEEGYYTQEPSEQEGYYAEELSEQESYYAEEPSEQEGYYAEEPSEQEGYYAEEPSEQEGYYAEEPSEQEGYYAQEPTEQESYYAEESSGQEAYYGEEPLGQADYYRESPSEQTDYYRRRAVEQADYYGVELSGQEGYYAENLSEQKGYYSEEPSGQEGYYAEEPLEQKGYNIKEPSEQEDYHTEEPTEQEGYYAEEPLEQKGYNSQEPSGQEGYYAKEPSELENYYAGEPSESEGYHAEEPLDRKGYNSQEPSEREDYHTEEPTEQEGYHTEEPTEQEGYYAEELLEQKGYNIKEPSEQEGYPKEEPSEQEDHHTEESLEQEDHPKEELSEQEQAGHLEELEPQRGDYAGKPLERDRDIEGNHEENEYLDKPIGKNGYRDRDGGKPQRAGFQTRKSDGLESSAIPSEASPNGLSADSVPKDAHFKQRMSQNLEDSFQRRQEKPFGTPYPADSRISREPQKGSSIIPLEKLIEKQAELEINRKEEKEDKDAEQCLESAFRAAKASREEKHTVPKMELEPGGSSKPRLNEEQREIFSYFVPVVGMEQQLCQVLEGVAQNKKGNPTSSGGNIVIMGGRGSGKTVLATDFIKAIQKAGAHPKGKVGKIAGDSLNQKDLGQLVRKVSGGYLIIERAGKMTHETVTRLALLMDQDTDGLLVILEDTRKEMEKVLSLDVNFAKKFTERIKIPVFTSDELVEFAKAYAAEQECEIDDMGILALYNRISNIQKLDEATTLTEVKEIVDDAINSAERGGLKKIFGRKKFSPEGYLYLRERDFDD